MLEGRHILIISPESWGVNLLSKHHYALELARRGNQVSFLGTKRQGEPLFQSRNLREIYFPTALRGTRFLPPRVRKKMDNAVKEKILEQLDHPPQVVWSFDNSRLPDLSIWGDEVIKIAHVMDFRMDKSLELYASSADLCLGVTQAIIGKLEKWNKHCHFVQHGVSLENFSENEFVHEGVTAVYVGNLNIPYIDWPLVMRTVDRFPQITFRFIGSTGVDNLNTSISVDNQLQALASKANVVLEGVLPQDELNRRIGSADILLLFYDHHRYFQEVANSHKVLSYLASGKVIVSTWIDEYKDKNLLEMTTSETAFLEKMSEVVARLNHYNGPEEVLKRRTFAGENTYSKQVDRIEEYIRRRRK